LLFRLLLVSALSLPALIPLTTEHFFASSDGLYHVHRAIEIDQCLRDGGIICRWAPDQFLGYGTPLFNFYSPFTYYLAAGFHALGMGWLTATKAVIATFMVLSGVGAFLYSATFLSLNAATVAAVVFVYVPYHLVNAYYRGDIPEFAAMALFPTILWAFSRLSESHDRWKLGRYFIAAAGFYALLVLSHNLSAFIFTPILALYCVWLMIRAVLEDGGGVKRAAFVGARLLGAAVLAGGLCAYLAFPALTEKELVQLKGLLYVSHTDHFPALRDILPNTVFHTYGIIFPDSPVYAYKMGLVQVVLGGIGAIAGLILFRRFRPRARTELIMSVLIFAIAFYFSQPPSLFWWETIPLLPLTQFPWRFLLLMALPTSIATGYLVDILAPRWRTIAASALVVFCLATNLWNLKPIMANVKDPEVGVREVIEFEMLYHLVGTTVAGEYVPRWVTDYPWVSPEALGRVVGARYDEAVHPMASDPWARVIRLDSKTGRASYHVSTDRPSRVVLNVSYFPGWKGWLNDQPVEIAPSEPEGMISVQVPPGEHNLRISFESTPIRAISDVVSAVSLVISIVIAVWAFRPRQKLVLVRPSRRELAVRGGLIAAALLLVPIGSARFYQSYLVPSGAQAPIKFTLGDVATLTGYDLFRAGSPLKRGELLDPGTNLSLNLYWRPEPGQAERAARTEAFVRLTNIDEQNWWFATETAREPVGSDGDYRTTIPVQIPEGLAPGVYQLDVGALSQGRNIGVRNMELVELLPTQGSIRLGPLYVTEGGSTTANLRYPAKALFADKIGIEGFQLARGLSDRQPVPEPVPLAAESGTPAIAAGDTLQVDVAWRALTSSPGIYHMSASLVDEHGFTWAVRESEPVDRMAPTWTWIEGQLIRDQLRMAVPAETPPGKYRLAMRVLDGERALNVLDQNGNPSGVQAMLGEVLLKKAEAPPREREVQVANRDRVRLNDDLDIMGGEYGRPELAPGEALDLQLIWRALRDVKRDYEVRVALEGRDGRTLAEQIGRPTGDANPTNRWEEREIFRGQYRLVPRAGALPGEANIVLELRDLGTGRTEVKREVHKVTIRGREGGSNQDQRPTVEMNAAFGPSIVLSGYTLAPGQTLRPGRDQQLLLTLFWKAVEPPGQALTVFTQLLGPDGKVAAQHDGPPDGGAQPTPGWLAGDSVVDEHAIPIDRALPAGEYRLITGLYDPVTGQRVSLSTGENFLQIATITVDPR
jgi:hypothetical protein